MSRLPIAIRFMKAVRECDEAIERHCEAMDSGDREFDAGEWSSPAAARELERNMLRASIHNRVDDHDVQVAMRYGAWPEFVEEHALAMGRDLRSDPMGDHHGRNE